MHSPLFSRLILLAGLLLSPALFAGDGFDPELDALLRRADAAMRAMTSFEMDTVKTMSRSAPGQPPEVRSKSGAHVRFMRPNYFTFDYSEPNQPGRKVHYQSDGEATYSALNSGKASRRGSPGADATGFFEDVHDELMQIYASGKIGQIFTELPETPRQKQLPDEPWQGETCHVVEFSIGGGYPVSWKIYIDPRNLVRRILHTEPNYGSTITVDCYIENLKPNAVMTVAEFAMTAEVEKSNGTRRTPLPENVVATTSSKPGDTVSDFLLPTPAGPRLPLSDVMKGSKAVLVNFWFVQCPPCRAEHPKLNALYEELKGKGLEVLGVDDQDAPENVTKYWQGAKLTFRTVLSGPRAAKDPATGRIDYRGPMLPDYASLQPWDVHSCPTNFIIDPGTNKIVYRASGWNEAAVRAKLAELGVK